MAYQVRKGRGALSNVTGRYERLQHSAFDDGWDDEALAAPAASRPQTRVTSEKSRSLISYNASPDLPFDRSVNPYRGCEHGCVYCYARPSHAYLGFSLGLDFETRLVTKPDAATVLRAELGKAGYIPAPLALGANTDPYQPIEREHQITRALLEVLAAHRHPVSIITKSNLVLRDIDILAPMAAQNLAHVAVSLTTLDRELARTMEPRAATPHKRLEALQGLSQAGIPTMALCAPIIPGVNDMEIEALLEAAHAAGSVAANYTLLRLPLEVKDLFSDWLKAHLPERAEHVLSLMRGCRGGALYDANFSQRMRGTGAYADLLRQRVRLARRRLGLESMPPQLRCDLFAVPPKPGDQLPLFKEG